MKIENIVHRISGILFTGGFFAGVFGIVGTGFGLIIATFSGMQFSGALEFIKGFAAGSAFAAFMFGAVLAWNVVEETNWIRTLRN